MADIYGDQNPENLNDTLNGDALIVDTSSGTPVVTQSGDDNIYAGEGDDSIFGNGGTDTLSGGNGNDFISGGHTSTYVDGNGDTQTFGGIDTIDGGAGNDTLTGGTQDAIIYGGSGDDEIHTWGNAEINGGTGNDQLSSNGASDFIFDANFGNDIINFSGEGSTVQFQFERPDDLQLYRNKEDLFLLSAQGFLLIKGYFHNLDPNSSDPALQSEYTISFLDADGNPTDIMSSLEIQNTIMNGGANDDTNLIAFSETSTDPIVLNGGAGDDWLQVGAFPGSPASSDRDMIADGGSGNDIYVLGNTGSTTLILGRDSGRDLVYGTYNSANPLYTDVTVQINQAAGAVDASQLSFSYDDGVFALNIAGSDAALVLDPITVAAIMADRLNWNVDLNGDLLSVKNLLLATPEFQSGELVLVGKDVTTSPDTLVLAGNGSASGAYDGDSNAGGETVLSAGGDIASGADNETFIGLIDTLTFKQGFGQDVVGGQVKHIVFEQEPQDENGNFTFSAVRDGYNLTITSLITGDSVLLRDYFSNNPPADFIFGSATSPTTAASFSSYFATLNTEDVIAIADGSTDAAPPAVEAQDGTQVFYADMGTATVNGGTGLNTIYSSANTTIVHDFSLGGHDEVVGNNGTIRLVSNSISDLSFSLEDGAHVRITVGDSSILLSTTGIYDLVFVDANGVETPLDNADFSSYFTGSTYTHLDEQHVAGSGAIEHITSTTVDQDDVLIPTLEAVVGTWLEQDGRGGSDQYYGSEASDIFIYSGTGDDTVKGLIDNPEGQLGFDIVDFSRANISSADLMNKLSRDGNNLVFTDGDDTLTIEDFFVQAPLASTFESVMKQQIYGGNVLLTDTNKSEIYQIVMSAFRGLALSTTPFSATHVVDSLKFTDRLVSYAEIAAMFPDTTSGGGSEPTEGDDVIYGTPQVDTLNGLGGNDTIYALESDDVLIGGSGSDALFGMDGADNLDGGSEGDLLDGGTGADTMAGGSGNDTYLVDDFGDVVTEAPDSGYDVVISSIDYTLSANVEELQMAAGAVNGFGNELDNTLQGNDAGNYLDGGAGDDLLAGGLGDDTYVVDSSNDIVLELGGQGIDTVVSSIDWELDSNIEYLTLTGSAVNGTGNELNNQIMGNDEANTLTGGLGNDRMTGGGGADVLKGGAGNDMYWITENDGNDTIVEGANGGLDLVVADRSFSIAPFANVENLTLAGYGDFAGTGNSGANVITGNEYNNTLTGGAGADVLRGGLGDDTYVIAATGDNSDGIVENFGEGTDLVRSAIDFTLGANVENLTLTGTAIRGSGNGDDNVITGNASDNILDGGAGNDTLIGLGGSDTLRGGLGDDTYVVGAGDTVQENFGQGIDTVRSATGFNLGTALNVENLILTGSAVNGTGNALDNVLTGNNAANTLNGGAGDDTLIGGKGNDALIGGVGNDTYVLNRGDGRDSISETDLTGDSHDIASFGTTGEAINHDQLWFAQNGQNLVVSVIGSNDKFVINNWYRNEARQVEEFVTSDGYHLSDTQVQNLVNAMASFAPPAAGTTTLDPGAYGAVLDQVAASWTA
jgi:Ca2+-binding RTX toxin-like protein